MPKETRFPQFGNYGDTDPEPSWLAIGLIIGIPLALVSLALSYLAGVFH